MIRDFTLQSFIVRASLTPMGKFLSLNLLDGSLVLYETLTGVTWRTEKIDGKHSGVAIACSNNIMEVAKEGMEHKLMNLLERDMERL